MTLTQAETEFFALDAHMMATIADPQATEAEREGAYYAACRAADLLYVVRHRAMRSNVLEFRRLA